MNASTNIIDVTPLAHSSSRLHERNSKTASSSPTNPSGGDYREPSWNRSSTGKGSPRGAAQTHVGGVSSYDQTSAGDKRTTTSPLSALGGLAQVAIGVGLVAIGIPMLVLPGPGFISIAAGGILIARGASKMKR